MIIDAHAHMFHGSYLEQLSGMGGDWAKKKLAAHSVSCGTDLKSLTWGNASEMPAIILSSMAIAAKLHPALRPR